MSKPEKAKYDFKSLLRVIRYTEGYKGTVALALFIALLLSAATSVRPYLTKIIIDDYIMKKVKDGLLEMILLVFGIILFQTVLQYLFIYIANWIGQSVIKDMRIKLFSHIQSFRLKYFNDTPIGILVTRSVSDIETIAMVFNDGVLVIFGDILKLIFVFGMMFYVNWQLSIIILLVIPILLLTTRWFQRAIKKTYQNIRTAVAQLNTFTQERLSGMHIVQAFAREEQELKKFSLLNENLKKYHIKTVFFFSLFFPAIELLASLAMGLIILYGGWQIGNDSNIQVGELIAFISFVQLIFRPMRQIADKFNSMQSGLVSANRVLNILDQDFAIKNEGTKFPKDTKGHIKFSEVNFSYKKDEPLLQNINFEVYQNETLAIVGATGAGKSTIISLLCRFFEIDNGKVTLDGTSIEDYELTAYREQMGIVLQDIFLFSDSIYNNISLGENYNRQEILEAAKDIGIAKFISSLPGGLDFQVQERGASMSVGQRQLLSFLRVYIKKPPILVLDEATSSVDTETEKMMQRAIDKITENTTSIVIAHRLSTIKNANKILVMKDGKILDQGTHKELLSRCEYYIDLYKAQFLDKSEEE